MTQDSDINHDEVVNSIRTHGLEVGAESPIHESDELSDLDSVFEDATIVGMGEATHRTREFAKFKHRFFEYLVRTHGFRLFGLEAQFAESRALYDYVVYGHGDAEAALDELVLDIHRTEEMASFLRWMRKFNANRPLADRIAIYGLDIQSPSGTAAALQQYLEEHDPGFIPSEKVLQSLNRVAEGVIDGYDVDADRLQTAEWVIAELEDHIQPRFEGEARSSGGAPALASHYYQTLQGACEFARAGMEADRNTQHGVRDRYMADTVEWILEYEPYENIALWGHNNHVKKGELRGTEGSAKTMGEHLTRQYESRYYALGFQFGCGSIRTLTPRGDEGDIEIDGTHFSREEISIPDPPDKSIPQLFAQVGESALCLDYRSLSPDSGLYHWLDESRPHHFITGVVDTDDDCSVYTNHNSVQEFDGLVFFKEATPTTPL